MSAALLFALAFAQAEPAPAVENPEVIAAGIARDINAYRRRLGLPPVPLSRALTRVATTHARDLAQNHPDSGADQRGVACNMHSWSARGPWTPVCYTPDHRYAQAMWSKPREITGGAYAGDGFEIAFMSTGPFTAEEAVDTWRQSPGHNGVIAERGTFAGFRWQAMGVGVADGYAVVWFGREPDPSSR